MRDKYVVFLLESCCWWRSK